MGISRYAHMVIGAKDVGEMGENEMIAPTSPEKGIVVAVANQKGGAGKTTTTINLAEALALAGRRVCVMDFDESAHGSARLGIDEPLGPDTFDVLTAGAKALDIVSDAIIKEGSTEHSFNASFDFVPSSVRLKQLGDWVNANRFQDPRALLRPPLEALRLKYDYIFLDTPPLFTEPMIPVYGAADFVIISATPEPEAVEAINKALEDIADAREGANPSLSLLGITICKIPYPRTRLVSYLLKELDENFKDANGEPVRFDAAIKAGVAMQEAAKSKTVIFRYEPDHAICEQYRELAAEVEARIQSRLGVLPFVRAGAERGRGVIANG